MAEFAHVVNEFDDWELLYCPYCGHNLIGPEDGGGGLRTRPCDHVLFIVDSEGGFQHLDGLAVQKLTENGATVEVGKFDCFVEFADVDEDDFLTTSEQVDRVCDLFAAAPGFVVFSFHDSMLAGGGATYLGLSAQAADS